MARITIEDCTRKVPNRFHLVQMASIRTKQLKKGAKALVQAEENKEVVVALREIAAGYIAPDYPEEPADEETPLSSEE
jgi:DNA-directed RNA polymerase subunit omega